MQLLTTGNPKTAKGEGLGYLTAILHLAPHTLSGRNVCAWATAGCSAACLNTAGRGGIGLDSEGLNTIQRARIARTMLFFSDRPAFMAQLVAEIQAHVRRASRHGLVPVVRLNGTSDLRWERIKCGDYSNIFAAFPNITFYDYTKYPLRKRDVSRIPNYSLTFSHSERPESEDMAREYLAAGMNVATVFRMNAKKKINPDMMPSTYMDHPVIDGDMSDLRFLDPSGVIVGLRSKGKAYKDASGFVKDIAA